jgi:hypothetical protein
VFADEEEFEYICCPNASDCDETVNDGKVGLLLSLDSKTPKIL